ncbi:MAG: DNA polymerase III subunit alpha [Weeksellaceae bacterium]
MIHLHTHTRFSVADATPSSKDLAIAAGHGSVLAITDHDSMAGIVEHHNACKAYGVKPVYGVELTTKDNHHLTLLAKNDIGLKNLFQLMITERSYEDIDRASNGIIALSGDLMGAIPLAILNEDKEAAQFHMSTLIDIFGDDFYLENIDHGLKEQKKILDVYQKVSKKYNRQIVTTNDVHYLRPEDYKLQAMLICDQLKVAFDFDFHLNKEAYLKDIQCPVAKYIASQCNVELDLGKSFLPEFPVPDEYEDEYHMIRQVIFDGLKSMGLLKDEYIARVKYELEIIKNMGFIGYYLIVWDFIKYAKDNGISVGPGRGSGAGSLIAYALGITNLDPIRYGLLFERFLNPDRVSMPDFDIDFSNSGRMKVVDYVIKKYGDDSVTQISTFGTLKPRSAWKAAARVLGIGARDSDVVSKMLPDSVKRTESLSDIFTDDGEIRSAYINEYDSLSKYIEERHKKVFPIATRLEGCFSNLGKHAAGVLVSKGNMKDIIPLWLSEEGAHTKYISQLQYVDAEKMGAIKFDFLGLMELDVIDYCLHLINKQEKEVIDVNRIEYVHDPETFEFISTGRTKGVFQIGSTGFMGFVQILKPDVFEDIIAAVALYRPGPMDYKPKGMHEEYADRKNGLSAVSFLHDDMKEILGETYGIIVYQEQIMLLAQKICGYTLGGADLLRRAMGKKKPEEMAKQKQIMISGGLNNGYSQEMLEELWSQIETFARYGFNKSHAAVYAKIAYITAYLKTHYTAELLAAQMQIRFDDTDAIAEFTRDALSFGIKIQRLDVSKSPKNFDVKDGVIRQGLMSVKGITEDAALQIEKNQPYESMTDFVDKNNLTLLQANALIHAGAMDGLLGVRGIYNACIKRAQLLASISSWLKSSRDEKRNPNQLSLFGDISYTLVDEFEPLSRLDLLRLEFESMGQYVSGHPCDEFRDEAMKLGATYISGVTIPDHRFMVCATVRAVEEIKNKNDMPMAFLRVEDESGSMDITVFTDDYLTFTFEEHKVYMFHIETSTYKGKVSASHQNSRELKGKT